MMPASSSLGIYFRGSSRTRFKVLTDHHILSFHEESILVQDFSLLHGMQLLALNAVIPSVAYLENKLLELSVMRDG
jgi:hypothetical protein